MTDQKTQDACPASRLNDGLGDGSTKGGYSEIPLYQSDATTAEREQKLEFMAKQLSVILDQEKMDTPSKFVKIRCACGIFSQWRNMYRCLYCGVWYCAECAEIHFGKRRA